MSISDPETTHKKAKKEKRKEMSVMMYLGHQIFKILMFNIPTLGFVI